jgi:hypothetical protein
MVDFWACTEGVGSEGSFNGWGSMDYMGLQFHLIMYKWIIDPKEEVMKTWILRLEIPRYYNTYEWPSYEFEHERLLRYVEFQIAIRWREKNYIQLGD